VLVELAPKKSGDSLNISKIAMAATLCAAGWAHAANVDFSGYFRAGTGVSERGGTQVCFGLPGADTKWRLGNECDYVIEPVFDTKVAEYEGSGWHVRLMPGVYRAWGQTEFGTDELVARFGQAYVYGNKIAPLANGTAWAGRRFYNRLQTGINDQFLENNDGDGAGIENMDFGFTKASVAFMMSGRGGANNNRFSVPVRLTDIKTVANGALSVYVTPSLQTRSRNQVTDTATPREAKGLAVGAYHTLGGVLGGELLGGVRYDKLGEATNSRAVLQQTGNLGAGTRFDVVAEYRLAHAANGLDSRWTAIGGRTDTHITGPFRVLVELGHDRVKPDGQDLRTMTKLTLAGAVSAGKDAWSRPTLRVFVTHAVWNEAARKVLGQNWINGERLQQVYGDRLHGTTFGVQTEAWW
jgi:maltoporin